MVSLHCAHCHATPSRTTKLLRCTACSATYYCSREHQKAHWKVHKSACQKKKTTTSCASPASDVSSDFYVVEVSEGQGNGLTNKMRNLRFSSRREGMEYVRRNGGFHLTKSPFATLLGWDVEIYWNPLEAAGLNAAGIYLSCELDSGFPPLSHHIDGVFGMIYVTPPFGSNRRLTSDILWGILNYIFDSMDYYGKNWPGAKLQAHLREGAACYRAQTWEPTSGTGGIPIYETDPDRCLFGPVFDMRGTHTQAEAELNEECEIDAFVAKRMEQKRQSELEASLDPDDMDDLFVLRQQKSGLCRFINSHAFPSEAAVQRFMAESVVFVSFRADFYRHAWGNQLYEAGAVENEEDRIRRIRRIGHTLNVFNGRDAMLVHFYVVHHVLCGRHFFQSNDYAEVVANGRAGYYSEVEFLWDGVGPWRWYYFGGIINFDNKYIKTTANITAARGVFSNFLPALAWF
eukprot:GEMP01030840.1.p1 GENE.GEMP01030840.1~~GEMP01030840.1.p1  ORF type:complete len:502 (+),score=79.56 GEMP01030840.1:130-1506(+)